MSTTGVTTGLDREVLRCEVRKEYAEVAKHPDKGFHFHTGRHLAGIVGYDPALLEGLPEETVAAFAGTGNPFRTGALEKGMRVLDIGCGAGIDSLIAARMVGPEGSVVGVDMTPEMIAKARASAEAMGLPNVTFEEAFIEELPLDDGWADVVISNGAVNLCPDKPAAYGEIHRVLKPGGRFQLADILVQKPVSEGAKKRIDLWTG